MAIVVNRKKLTFFERLYLPVVIGGLKVTGRHLFRTLFGGKAVTRYVSWSATRIRFKVPALAKGRKSVTVRPLGGKSNVKAFRVI